MGGKTYTYENIKSFIEGNQGNGCRLLMSKNEFEQEIINKDTIPTLVKLKIQCKCGNKFYKTFDTFNHQNRRQCKKCGNKDKKAISYEKIKEYINSKETGNGCELITTKEQFEEEKIKQNKSNSLIKLKILCGQCGKEIFYTSFSNFKQKKKQCYICGRIAGIQKRTGIIKENISRCLSLEDSYQIAYEHELIPLYKEYKNSQEKLLFKTKEGYKVVSSIKYIKREQPIIFGKSNPYTIENIQLYLKLNNLNIKLKSNEFKSACKDKLIYECEKGHIYEASWNNIQSHHCGCPICYKENYGQENTPNWKGGISSLTDYLRGCILQWKKDTAKACNYKCVITNSKFDIIHHLYGFNLIVQEVINICNLPIYDEISKYSDDELKIMEQICLQLHYKYGLGICLRKDIHNLFHSIYGQGNNTPEQFKEFKQKYYNKEFKLIK